MRFVAQTDAWSVTYEARYINGSLRFNCTTDGEIELGTSRKSLKLSEWLNEVGLTFLLEGDQLIDPHGFLYKADSYRAPYSIERLQVLDWGETDLHVESQGAEHNPLSIQARAIEQLRGEDTWDVILDDDGPGETADIVGMKIDEDGLLVKFVHCKYAHGHAPGARLADLYEVCGQASKSVTWRKADLEPFFRYLDRRARNKYSRTNVSPFVVGDPSAFYRLQDRATIVRRRLEVVIAQPGLAARRASRGQLELLAACEQYLRNTANASLEVWCSE